MVLIMALQDVVCVVCNSRMLIQYMNVLTFFFVYTYSSNF